MFTTARVAFALILVARLLDATRTPINHSAPEAKRPVVRTERTAQNTNDTEKKHVAASLLKKADKSLHNASVAEIRAKSSANASRIVPELDPTSDSKFFKGDFPEDRSPRVDRRHHKFNHPYPIVQDSGDFDRDFVKDQNSDSGEWKAQLEYDKIRSKVTKEQRDVDEASEREEQAKTDLNYAKSNLKKAEVAVKDAENRVAKATSRVSNAEARLKDLTGSSTGDASGGQIGKAAADVEAKIQALEECKKKLAEAKARLQQLLKKMDRREQAKADAEAMKIPAEREKVAAQDQITDLRALVEKERKEFEASRKVFEQKQAIVKRTQVDLDKAAKVLRKYRKQVDSDGGVYWKSEKPAKGAKPASFYRSGTTAAHAGIAVLAAISAAMLSL